MMLLTSKYAKMRKDISYGSLKGVLRYSGEDTSPNITL
jgi:hypothetical protein